MTTWFAVLIVGLGSYAFRVTPLLLGHRLRLGERAQLVLRHAGMGGIAALLVTGLTGHGGTGGESLVPAIAGVGLSAVLAYRGRPMLVVLLAGAGMFAAVKVAESLLG